ncbi:MAG: putative metal-binding motif-containing protein [Polyangiales bacterium]
MALERTGIGLRESSRTPTIARNTRGALALCAALIAGCAAPMENDAAVSDASDARPFDAMRADTGVCEDNDNDGHPSAACGGDDCDDSNPRRNPGNREVCDGLGLDEDCDPCTVGESLPSGRGGDADRDEDGFASSACFNLWRGTRPTCAPVTAGEAGTFEGVTVSDNEVRGRDCDDTTRTRNPAASERCDERLTDENCNDSVNEGCECPTVADPAVSRRCLGAMGECARGTQDCVDGRWSMCSIAPARETCNDRDDNCDGTVDEGLRTSCYRDVDGDGLAAAGTAPSRECGIADPSGALSCPAGFTAVAPMGGSNSDCDDSVATGARRSPRLMEIPCNAVDDDCSAATSDACPGGQSCGASGTCGCPSGQALCGGRCQASGGCEMYPASMYPGGYCTYSGTYTCNAATGVSECRGLLPSGPLTVTINGADSRLSHSCGRAAGTSWDFSTPISWPCFAVFGPFLSFPRGRYSVEFTFDFDRGNVSMGTVDAWSGGTPLATGTWTSCQDPALSTCTVVRRLTFDIAQDCRQGVEFRVEVTFPGVSSRLRSVVISRM